MDRKSMVVVLAFAVAACQAQGGATDADKGGDTEAASSGDEAETGEPEPEAGSGLWNASWETDPMTDVQVGYAKARLQGLDYDVEIVAACGNEGEYSFTVFDKEGEGAAFKSHYGQFGPVAVFEYRIDDAKANQFPSRMKYTNQVRLPAYLFDHNVMGANRLRVRLPLLTGEAVYDIDQSDPEFRRVVKPCVERSLAAVRERKEEAERRRVEREAEDAERLAKESAQGNDLSVVTPSPPASNTTY